ncbi:glutathione S-transferase THETA 2 [Striga asiatica]|uniref:Glutathione S-transferase THETA 2 n=1 Tax=Striga asiatica TaxID=4170 RepID=A0A5A7PXJ6_STRAF|nr:glutathione S-transferase THETA 2 [Striga asiatica]
MWNRILLHWKENMGANCNNSRNTNSLGCRWGKIQSAVSKFHGIYERLERIPQNGSNMEDLKREAKRAYEDINNKKKFKFEHCWEIMRKNPKWCTNQLTKTNGSNKSKADNVSHLPTDLLFVNLADDTCMDPLGSETLKMDGLVRPQGRKASKDKKRKPNDDKGVVEVLGKLQCTLEMHVNITREELELKKEREEKEHELREQDLTKLSPTMRETFEMYRVQILKEWENDGCLSSINQVIISYPLYFYSSIVKHTYCHFLVLFL